MNKRNIFFWNFLLIFCLFSSACVTQDNAVATTNNKKQSWSVILSISGGFAGLMRNISIDEDGSIIINDLKNSKSIRKKLNNKELQDLSDLLDKLKGTSSSSSSPGFSRNCKDCYQYKLSIRWQNSQVLASLNDINLKKSPYKALVIFLKRILSKYYI